MGEHSSFRLAAEKSFRSASAVSSQIRQLESQLGVALFHRTTRNVRLTAEGEQLLACAERALLELDNGLRHLREQADMRRGRVSFSCSPTIAETRLARVLAAFRQEYPGVEIRVRELTSEALFETIRKREADFGIGPQVETDEFQFDPILTDPLYASCRARSWRPGVRPLRSGRSPGCPCCSSIRRRRSAIPSRVRCGSGG